MPNNFLFSVPFDLKLQGYSVFMITKEEWKPEIIQEKQAIFQEYIDHLRFIILDFGA